MTKRSWRDAIYCVLQYPWNVFRCYSVNVFSWPQYYKFTNAEKVLNRIFTKTVGLEYEEPFNKPSIATIEWVRIWSDANSLSVLSFVLYVVTQLLSCFFKLTAQDFMCCKKRHDANVSGRKLLSHSAAKPTVCEYDLGYKPLGQCQITFLSLR